MKVKVLRTFRDKYTKEIYAPGAEFKCDDEERVKDLVARGFVKASEEPAKKAPAKKAPAKKAPAKKATKKAPKK